MSGGAHKLICFSFHLHLMLECFEFCSFFWCVFWKNWTIRFISHIASKVSSFKENFSFSIYFVKLLSKRDISLVRFRLFSELTVPPFCADSLDYLTLGKLHLHKRLVSSPYLSCSAKNSPRSLVPRQIDLLCFIIGGCGCLIVTITE